MTVPVAVGLGPKLFGLDTGAEMLGGLLADEMIPLEGMRERLTVQARGAEALYDSADPYTRKLVIDRGEGGREAAEAALDGAPLFALYTAEELLEAGRSGA